jgi:organic radical activating enzyme
MEPYAFQNIYVITTYRCNWKCPFCLFRFNKEKEASTDEILSRIEGSILDSSKRVYIKITGGEPFLKPKILQGTFELAKEHEDKVYKVGIGTNGSFPLPSFFNDVGTRTHLFLSRHKMTDSLPTPDEMKMKNGINNPLIDFRVNCNLIRGQIDGIRKIKEYIEKRHSMGIGHFCFRELSRVQLDKNLIYASEIYRYVEYYYKHLVLASDMEDEMLPEDGFSLSRCTGNYYDINRWFWYSLGDSKISVKFRTIDEVRLIEYNDNHNGVDEYVVHPDGTLTGCWDKERKIIVNGGDPMPSRPYIPKPKK